MCYGSKDTNSTGNKVLTPGLRASSRRSLQDVKMMFVKQIGLGEGVQAEGTRLQSLDSTAERDVLV